MGGGGGLSGRASLCFPPIPVSSLAFKPPADIGRDLSSLRGGVPGARWIDPENYHVTLRFIGDVDDVVALEAAAMLGMGRRTEFGLRFDALASSGGRRPPALVATLARTPPSTALRA